MTTKTAVVAIVIAFVAGSVATLPARQGRRYFTPRTPGDPAVTPFSGAVLAGDTLYLSGVLGLGADRALPPTAEAEARAVLTAVKTQLEAAGMTMDDLVSVQIYSSNVADYDAFNRVYRTFFTKEFPARAFLGAGPLLFNARFEVMGTAVKR